MTSFNRIGGIGAGGDYNLLTNILKGEWGMQGFALTDFSNTNSYMDVIQGVLAGGDAWDYNDANKWTPKLNDCKITQAKQITSNSNFLLLYPCKDCFSRELQSKFYI